MADCSLLKSQQSEMDCCKGFVRHQCLPLQHFVKNLEGEPEFEFYSDIFKRRTFVTIQKLI